MIRRAKNGKERVCRRIRIKVRRRSCILHGLFVHVVELIVVVVPLHRGHNMYLYLNHIRATPRGRIH